MKLPRDLSGNELAACLFKKWAYTKIHQTGSHIILEAEDPSHQRIAVPAHAELRIGTLASILRSIAEHKGVRKQDILDTL